MSDPAATPPAFETWNVPECPFTIEYRASLMQELRAAVAYGQQAFTRGGMEVGGVLLGLHTEAGISIRAWRPIACEHAHGPALVLSERDRGELRKFLDDLPVLRDLSGLGPVGWFLSHTRSDISLRDSDLQLFNEFFSAATDVALVLRPGRHGAARAGFFFRNPDGSVAADQSLLEFNIEGESLWMSRPAERIPVALPELPPRPPATAPATPPSSETASAWLQTRRAETPEAHGDEPGETSEADELEEVEEPDEFGETDNAEAPMALPEPRLTGRRSWRWIALPIAALIAIGWLYFTRNRVIEPLDLPINMTVTDRDGQLVVEWDHARPELQQVQSGQITVVDGSAKVNLPLTPSEAQRGSFTFVRQSGDVRVSLHLERPGKPLNASARFLGAPPVREKPVSDTDAAELDRLRTENTELRTEVDRSKARTDQAETVIRVLRERVDAAEAKAAARH